MLSQVSK
jgi:hypothetical protein